MALWSLLGARGVDMIAFDSFWRRMGHRCCKATQTRRRQKSSRPTTDPLPDLTKVDTDRDVVFTWNGTTSGVRIPDGNWIKKSPRPNDLRRNLGRFFAMDLPWDKLDVVTWSWQKFSAGEAGHGMIALHRGRSIDCSPIHRHGRYPRFSPDESGKLIEGIFTGETINTPSMLCVADALDGLCGPSLSVDSGIDRPNQRQF